jgi:hypothetical protein
VAKGLVPEKEVTMQAGLHAFSWSLQRLAIGLAIITGSVLFALVMLVAIIVIGQAATGFAQ